MKEQRLSQRGGENVVVVVVVVLLLSSWLLLLLKRAISTANQLTDTELGLG